MRSCWLLLKQSIDDDELAGMVSDVSVIACKGKRRAKACIHTQLCNGSRLLDFDRSHLHNVSENVCIA